MSSGSGDSGIRSCWWCCILGGGVGSGGDVGGVRVGEDVGGVSVGEDVGGVSAGDDVGGVAVQSGCDGVDGGRGDGAVGV